MRGLTTFGDEVRRLSFILSQTAMREGLQMILFPLIATWMWFQIFTASPLPSSGRADVGTLDADISLLPVPSVI
jgi:hypothetical protein